MELEQGEGLARLIPLLARPRRGSAVVIVRNTLLGALAARVGQAEPRVVAVEAGNRDAAWAEMQRLLFAERK